MEGIFAWIDIVKGLNQERIGSLQIFNYETGKVKSIVCEKRAIKFD